MGVDVLALVAERLAELEPRLQGLPITYCISRCVLSPSKFVATMVVVQVVPGKLGKIHVLLAKLLKLRPTKLEVTVWDPVQLSVTVTRPPGHLARTRSHRH